MDAIDCIKTRMSIRKFKPDPVPGERIAEVIETAQRSPSYKNCQAWSVAVISGRKKDELAELLVAKIEAGEPPAPDIAHPPVWPDDIGERIERTMKIKSEQLGMDLEAPEVKQKSRIANSRFFGAPHGIFIYQDGSLSNWQIFDAGLFVQTLMLAAHAHGLGTVPQAFLTDYAADVKKFLGIPATDRLVLGLSLGYPDRDAPINQNMTDREPVGKIIKWVE